MALPQFEKAGLIFTGVTVLFALATIAMFLPLRISLLDTAIIAGAVIVWAAFQGLILEDTDF
jgi:hypothetical protein